MIVVVAGFARVRSAFAIFLGFLSFTSFAKGGMFLESVIITVLLVKGVKRLVTVVALAVSLLQVALLTLSIATICLVETTLVRFSCNNVVILVTSR